MPSSLHQSKSASVSGRSSTKSAAYRGGLNISDPTSTEFTPTTISSGQPYDVSVTPKPTSSDATWLRTDLPALGHSRSGSNLQILSDADNRLSAGPSIIISSMSSMPSLTQHQKKPSGLKATIKRMFGSKRRRTIVDETNQQYHRSDPGNLMFTEPPQHQRGYSSGSSRPRTAMKGGALTSHAVTPEFDIRDFEVPITQQLSTIPKRRNTATNLVPSEYEAHSFSRRLGDLMVDDTRLGIRNETYTSDTDKRRSKSAEGLAAKYHGDASNTSNRQDRESEIAFWRNSFLLNSLPKSTDQDTSRLSTQPSSVEIMKETPSLEHIIRPNQSFDFGLDNTDEEPTELEERVNTLEVKMYDFEYAIAKLQGIELPRLELPTRKYKRRNVQEVFTKPSIRSLSTATSGLDRTPITPEDSPLMSHSFAHSSETDRGSKATTIRPYIRVDSPTRTSLRLTAEQYNALLTMIQHEKDARQLMEFQIMDLQREVELLQAPVYATINYPASDLSKGAITQKKLHRSPPFRFHRPTARETSRFSTTESETESVNEGFEDTFQTPREQQLAFENAGTSPLVGESLKV